MSMSPWLVVAKREFLERVRTKWFIIVTLLGPLFMGGIIIVPAVLSARAAGKKTTVVLWSAAPGPMTQQLGLGLRATDPQLAIEVAPAGTTEEALLGRIRTRAIDGYLIVPPDLLDGGEVRYRGDNASNFGMMARVQAGLQIAVITARAERAGIGAERLAPLLERVPFESELTTGEKPGGTGMASFILGYAAMFILYMSILLYAVNVLRSVVLEKTSRVIEVIISSVRPAQLMTGKIAGVGAVGLLQLGIWLSMAGVILAKRGAILRAFGVDGDGGFELPPVGADAIFVILAAFVLGFFFYAALYAAIGAMCNSDQEAQQAQTPVVLLLVIPVACVQLVAGDPRGTVAQVLTWIPFASPVLLPMRYLLGGASFVEALGSLATLGLALAGAIWVAARIYRVGILMYGKRPGLTEVWRWIRQSG